MNNNSWYGRHPRTMNEAFGPCSDDKIYESVERTPLFVKVAYVAVLIGACVAIGVMLALGSRA